jgi:hypothetical protein
LELNARFPPRSHHWPLCAVTVNSRRPSDVSRCPFATQSGGCGTAAPPQTNPSVRERFLSVGRPWKRISATKHCSHSSPLTRRTSTWFKPRNSPSCVNLSARNPNMCHRSDRLCAYRHLIRALRKSPAREPSHPTALRQA